MSFILDALKKSEAERQRKGAPGIADVPQSSGKSGGVRWVWISGVLLAVNLAVLAGLILRPASKSVALQDPQPSQTQQAAPIENMPPRFSDIVAEAKRSQPEVSAAPATQTAASPTETQEPAPAAIKGNRPRVVDGPVTFNELRANGSLQLPDLHLDIHVYSAKPADRFVFINMSRYRENATLTEGPLVREITPEGVILEYLGTRFLLPRE